jgi:transcriptional regulator with XRE-family HTH domain
MREDMLKKIGERFRKLREDECKLIDPSKESCTQRDVAAALEKYIGYDGAFRAPGMGVTLVTKTGNSPNSTPVSRYEKGSTDIGLLTLLAYAEVFDVSVDYLSGQIDTYNPENKSVMEVTGLNEGAIHSLRMMHNYYNEENVKKRLRLNGISEKNLEKRYQQEKREIKKYHNEDICNLISYTITDVRFWGTFNDSLNNIFKLLKESAYDEAGIGDEKTKVINLFIKLLDSCIESFKGYNKKHKKLF